MNFIKFIDKKIVSHAFLFTVFNIIEKAIPFLILPIITRILPKNEIGLFILYQTIIEILIPIVTFNIDSAILLKYYKLKESDFSGYFSNGILVFTAVYLLYLLFSFLLGSNLSNFLSFPKEGLFYASAIIFFRFYSQLMQNILRVKYKVFHYGYFTIFISLIKYSSGLILITLFDHNWVGLLQGNLISYFLAFMISLYYFYHNKLITYEILTTNLKSYFKLGFPLTLHKSGLWLGNTANQIIIANKLGPSSNASYGIGSTFSVIISVIEDAINKSFVPHLYDKLISNKIEIKKEIVKINYILYIVIISLSIIMAVIGYNFIDLIFGKEYLDTRIFIYPLVFSSLFKGLYKIHINYIFFKEKMFTITKITLFTGILNLILSIFFINYFGLLGAAYSLLITSLIQYLLAFYVGNKLIPLPWFNFN